MRYARRLRAACSVASRACSEQCLAKTQELTYKEKKNTLDIGEKMIDYEIGYRFTNDEGYLDQHGGYKQAAQQQQQQMGSPGLQQDQFADPNAGAQGGQDNQGYLSGLAGQG